MGNTVVTGSATSAAGRRRPVTVKSTERKEADNHGYKLQCAVSGMRGWRPTMEDQHIMQVELSKELADHCLFAIFDGHGGGLTSTYLEQKFLQVLMQQPTIKQYVGLCPHGHMSRSDVGGVKMLQEALKETFEQLDQELLALQNQVNSIVARRHEGRLQQLLKQQRQQTTAASNGSSSPESFSSPLTSTDANVTPPTLPPPPIERSGSTAIVVLLTPTHIVTANTGDSRAMLRRHGLVVPLSFDHKPNDIPERRRILRASGFVRHRRVDGDLAVSRAFGDFSYKNANHKVIVTPEFTVYPRDSSGDEFIVLACDGIWDVATNQECSEYVQTMLATGEMDLGYICEDALDLCLERKSRDNMTLMIVSLPGIQIDYTSRSTLQNALWTTHRRMRSLGSSLQSVKGACEAVSREAALKLQEVTKPIIRTY